MVVSNGGAFDLRVLRAGLQVIWWLGCRERNSVLSGATLSNGARDKKSHAIIRIKGKGAYTSTERTPELHDSDVCLQPFMIAPCFISSS